MNDIALTEHLESLIKAAKNDTNKKFLDLNNAVTETLEDLDNAKASKTEIQDVLDFAKLIRLYIDEDGDYAQRDSD